MKAGPLPPTSNVPTPPSPLFAKMNLAKGSENNVDLHKKILLTFLLIGKTWHSFNKTDQSQILQKKQKFSHFAGNPDN